MLLCALSHHVHIYGCIITIYIEYYCILAKLIWSFSVYTTVITVILQRLTTSGMSVSPDDAAVNSSEQSRVGHMWFMLFFYILKQAENQWEYWSLLTAISICNMQHMESVNSVSQIYWLLTRRLHKFLHLSSSSARSASSKGVHLHFLFQSRFSVPTAVIKPLLRNECNCWLVILALGPARPSWPGKPRLPGAPYTENRVRVMSITTK